MKFLTILINYYFNSLEVYVEIVILCFDFVDRVRFYFGFDAEVHAVNSDVCPSQ